MNDNLNINKKSVNLIFDLLDKACMVYYDDLKTDYLEAYIKVVNCITESDNIDESKLSSKALKKLGEIVKKFEDGEFLNEEVRLASELVLIKGFKTRNVLLDFLTPDTINYIFSYIINSIITNNKVYSESERMTIIDTALGTGNLLQTIINNSPISIKGIGIDCDELLVHIAQSLSKLLDNDLIINYGNAKNDIIGLADVIIADFGETKDCYDIILKRLDNLDDKGYFVYLINNDFFTKTPEHFKEMLIKSTTLAGLIVLPTSFVNKNHIGKSILIGKKEVLRDYQMAVIQFKEELTTTNIQNTFNKINKMIKVIGG